MGVTLRWVAEVERWLAVPRQRDGWLWLSEMGGCAEAERWVADTVRWVAEAERWVAVPRQRDGWLRQRDMCHSEMDGRGREMGG
jgi:hypothetical protein